MIESVSRMTLVGSAEQPAKKMAAVRINPPWAAYAGMVKGLLTEKQIYPLAGFSFVSASLFIFGIVLILAVLGYPNCVKSFISIQPCTGTVNTKRAPFPKVPFSMSVISVTEAISCANASPKPVFLP